jgi:GNAT superfamily N-acetyltransferase
MSSRFDQPRSCLPGVVFAPFELLRTADVRAMQIAAFRSASSQCYDDVGSAAFEHRIAGAELAGRLQRHDVELAMVGTQVVGTAGWTQARDTVENAQLTDLFVEPLFMRLGIGSALVVRVQERVRRAGFGVLTAQGSLAMTEFFLRLGFRVSAYGSFAPAAGVELSVVFLRKALLPAMRAAVRDRRPKVALVQPRPGFA